MSDEQGAKWLVEPPQPGQIRVAISIPEETEVSDRLRSAVDEVIAALEDEEGVKTGDCWLDNVCSKNACGKQHWARTEGTG
ncbi:MAG TPA: hypothetical protein VF517_03830 [Thermoleophilaceae bacterium]|jgi:hypothetical protein